MLFITLMIRSIYRKLLSKNLRQKIFFIRQIINSKNTSSIFSYYGDGLATNHITDFMKDEIFINNYFKAAEGTNHRIFYRAYILNYFANYALNLIDSERGCFVELGTHKGLMAKLVLLNSNIDKKKINFYLFDTFQGIPLENVKKDEIKHIKEINELVYKEDVYEFVKQKFSNFSSVKIVKGLLPDSLKSDNINLENIKFLHIDLNNAHAEIESIKILYEKISKGAPVILDDYCFSETYRTQKDAWDEFAKEKGFAILSLPTGQGFFLKN
jgi:hypothetical protein